MEKANWQTLTLVSPSIKPAIILLKLSWIHKEPHIIAWNFCWQWHLNNLQKQQNLDGCNKQYPKKLANNFDGNQKWKKRKSRIVVYRWLHFMFRRRRLRGRRTFVILLLCTGAGWVGSLLIPCLCEYHRVWIRRWILLIPFAEFR